MRHLSGITAHRSMRENHSADENSRNTSAKYSSKKVIEFIKEHPEKVLDICADTDKLLMSD
jgi:hypothetical protein